MPGRARILGLAGLAILLAVEAAPGQVVDSAERYPSGDRTVPIECFAPAGPGKYPAVILLHGSGGLAQATGPVFREIASALALRGYAAFIPHFFEKTDHPLGARFRPGEYESWMAAVKDAVDFAAKRPEVDPDRFGFIGYSMGANLAEIQAARDPRVKALVHCSGSYPPGYPKKAMKPLLILHGAKDTGTPVALVKQFQEKLAELESPHAVHIYPGMGHNFDVPRFADASGRAARFFDQYLKVRPEPAKPPARKPSRSRT